MDITYFEFKCFRMLNEYFWCLLGIGTNANFWYCIWLPFVDASDTTLQPCPLATCDSPIGFYSSTGLLFMTQPPFSVFHATSCNLNARKPWPTFSQCICVRLWVSDISAQPIITVVIQSGLKGYNLSSRN